MSWPIATIKICLAAGALKEPEGLDVVSQVMDLRCSTDQLDQCLASAQLLISLDTHTVYRLSLPGTTWNNDEVHLYSEEVDDLDQDLDIKISKLCRCACHWSKPSLVSTLSSFCWGNST